MEVYKFKCKSCGSTKYDKVDKHIFKCQYCGNTEEVLQKTVEKIIIKEVHISEDKQKDIAEKKEELSNSIINFAIVIFLGVFGVHKFLKGKILIGIVYLFTYGLFGFGVFIDIIKAIKRVIVASKKYHITRG